MRSIFLQIEDEKTQDNCPHVAGKRKLMVLWRLFLAKICEKRQTILSCQSKAHEYLEVPYI
ncbi:hypothetical protein FACS1894102_0640 [Spirochaetia bacterium]|nr:hypothetical protein FACS1894102_0640 [Spirochaetia bacterium]